MIFHRELFQLTDNCRLTFYVQAIVYKLTLAKMNITLEIPTYFVLPDLLFCDPRRHTPLCGVLHTIYIG